MESPTGTWEVKDNLTRQEYNGLRRVRETIDKHGTRLRKAFDDKSVEKMFRIAEDFGYYPRSVPFGTEFINTRGERDVLSEGNPVRIGQVNVLYVGVNENGNIPSFKHLAHDVATIVLGGKQAREGEKNKTRIETFNDVVLRSTGRTYSQDQLDRAQVLTESGDRVARNYLFEAIVYYDRMPKEILKVIP